ncbi:GDSL-like lipase/acylhydrolase family protein [Actinomycetospora succinea]|uniref:GDSL-like lipase/acylhydrolase family protein n=1 Tax=Actinomycetospora succinea TaxID=663603 RepID=A0A4R6ULJ7_9PSEU|nr:SGNH/GDSL hydrolase family protein [Actinomycetospora succinea]TDQ47900.1 GDSL-like lipase/acylhydrolase family protein [Actinomycetospora succinea]
MGRRPIVLRLLVAVAVALLGVAVAPVAMGAPAAAGQAYVALGDSYTASPLTGAPTGPPPGCLRSANNYPHLVAERTGAQLTDVSCSGAQTKDFAAPQPVQGGENPAQYDALGRGTQLVTVGIGGNDIGFSEIVQACVSPTPFGTPCRDRYTQGAHDELEARIDTLGDRLDDVLDEVHSRAPDARVLLVGYPSVLPAEGPGCYPLVPYTPGDVEYLRGVLTHLNAEIADAASDGDATYVDTATPSLGHDVCAVPGERWIEGLVPTAPAAPVHPNALGSAALSRAVLATLGVPTPA